MDGWHYTAIKVSSDPVGLVALHGTEWYIHFVKLVGLYYELYVFVEVEIDLGRGVCLGANENH